MKSCNARAVARLAVIVAASGWLESSRVLAADDALAIEVPQRAALVDFETEILPILRANCLACHNARKAESKLNLETPQSIGQGGELGPAVIAGKSAESLLLRVAAHRQESFMPPADNSVGARPLTPAQLGLISLWIDQGAAGTVSSRRNVNWRPLPASFQSIGATAVTPDGQFAVCNRGNRLFVYHVPSSRLAAMLVDPDVPGPVEDSSPRPAHRDVIRALAFDPAGDLLASGGFREVKLWRRPRVRQLAEWPLQTPVEALAIRLDGQVAAVGDETGRIRIYDVRSGSMLHSIAAHQAAVRGLGFSSDGSTLYSGSLDKSWRAWNAADGSSVGQPVQVSAAIHGLALILDGEQLVTGAADGTIHVWKTQAVRDAGNGETPPLHEIRAHNGAISSIVALPSRAGEFLSGGEDGIVRQWDARSAKQVREFRHEGPVVALAARPDGRRIASAGARTVKLWNGDNGQQVTQWQGDPRLAAKVTQLDAEIAFTKSAIALAQQDIKAYEGPERRVMTTAQDVKKAEEEVVKAQKTRDEKNEAAVKAKAENKNVEAADKAAEEAETAVLVAGTIVERAKVIAERAVQDLAAAQQAVVKREELLKQQEATKAIAVAEASNAARPFRSLAFSADNARLAVGCDDGVLHFFDAESGTPTDTVAGHQGAVRAIACVPDGTLVTSSADGTARVWTTSSLWRLERLIGSSDRAESLVDRVLALDFDREGRHLATGGGVASRSGEVKIWNVADGELVREFPDAHVDTVLGIRYSPDGRHLASAGADRLVKVFSTETGECVRTLAGHTGHVLGVSWKGDGQWLVSCGADRVLKLWDFATGLPKRTMKGTTYQIGAYKREVTAVSFVGDSEEILAASGDGTVRLHRTTSDNDILTFANAQGYQYSATVTPDGQTVVVGGSDGILRIWVGHQQQPKHTFSP